MPPDLRPSLYIKDDDYIESFAHGNFITLTNTSRDDIEKIIKFRITPLNISLHSFSRDVRDLLFGSKKNYTGVDNLFKLDGSGISTNIQIVLCPGINDGSDLKNTLDILINQFKNVMSVGIVPVGVTRFNREHRLKPYNRYSSKKLLEFIKTYRKSNRDNKRSGNIYLSDEFYLLAEEKFPAYTEYGNLEQIQNGIGKAVDFLHEIKKYISENTDENREIITNNTLIVTSEYGREVFSEIIELFAGFKNKFRSLENLNLDFLTVKNTFFGGNVRVTGLLTGKDIFKELENMDLKKYDNILLPSSIFNMDGLTLDDYVYSDFLQINDKISFVHDNGRTLAKKIFNGNQQQQI
jgi:putative radical SAM enzyme (TIGR03279 family)